MNNNLKACKVLVKYNSSLSKITHKDKETCVINEELPFIMFLSFIFSSYPEIESKYPAGKLAFTLNGNRPSEFDILHNNDIVYFSV